MEWLSAPRGPWGHRNPDDCHSDGHFRRFGGIRDKREVVARAEGDAKRFISVYNEYKLAKDVTTQRLYLETMEEILRRTNKVIIDSGASGSQGVVPYLPLPEVQKRIRGQAK